MRNIWVLIIVILFLNGCGNAGQNRKKKHFLHKGNIAFKEKLYDEAVRYYKAALEVDLDFAQAYNNLGIVYQKKGDYQLAADAFDQCLEKDPNFTDAYYNRSNVNNEIGNFYKSLDDLRFIDGKYESKAAVQFSKGIAFFGLQQYDSASNCFSKALMLDSANIENYVNLATAKYYLKNYEEAKTLLDSALAIDPDFTSTYNVMGMIHTSLGDYESALGDFNRGLAMKSNDALMLNNRGFVYLMIHENEKALADINESIVIDPANPWAYRNKGIYYHFSGDDVNAERLLLQSAKMDATIELSHFYLGEIYLEQGNEKKACEEFSVSTKIGDKEGEMAYRQYCQ